MDDRFLETEDYLVFLSATAFAKLTRDGSKLDECERNAYGYINEKLCSRFRIAEEMAKRGGSRNASLVRWMSVLSVYYLYQSAPDDEIPERIVKNYDDVLKEIGRVASGIDNTTLAPVTSDDGKPKTAFKWSSRPKRTHNPFEY